ncbi:MAG: transposase [Pseudoxanthomonas sp.]
MKQSLTGIGLLSDRTNKWMARSLRHGFAHASTGLSGTPARTMVPTGTDLSHHDDHPVSRAAFPDWPQASTAAAIIANAQNWSGAKLLCWVLMPDHWHGMVELQNETQLSVLIRLVKGRMARAVNLASGRRGPVWMPGFHDRALRNEESLIGAARYIVANPLRAGLARRIGDYPYWDCLWLSQE